jgi:hypothetical protein
VPSGLPGSRRRIRPRLPELRSLGYRGPRAAIPAQPWGDCRADQMCFRCQHCGVLRVPSGSRVHGNLTGVALPAVVGTADWYRGTQCLYTDTNTPATLSPAFG